MMSVLQRLPPSDGCRKRASLGQSTRTGPAGIWLIRDYEHEDLDPGTTLTPKR